MRESELLEQLGGLAESLDDLSDRLDVETVLLRPRRRRPVRPAAYGGLAVAAAIAVLVGLVALWPSPSDDRADVSATTRPQIDIIDADTGANADTNADARPASGADRMSALGGPLMLVAGSGFDAGVEVTVRQCAGDTCDDWRPPVRVLADDQGEFTSEVAVYDAIAGGRGSDPGPPVSPTWGPCAPCKLRAEAGSQVATIAFDPAPSRSVALPSLRIITPGPYQPGQRVRIVGSGFRADPDGLEMGVAYCPVEAQSAEQCGGGPELGDFAVAADGSFVVENFELPTADTDLEGVRCAERPGRCVLTWYLTAPGPLPAGGIPLDLVDNQNGGK